MRDAERLNRVARGIPRLHAELVVGVVHHEGRGHPVKLSDPGRVVGVDVLAFQLGVGAVEQPVAAVRDVAVPELRLGHIGEVQVLQRDLEVRRGANLDLVRRRIVVPVEEGGLGRVDRRCRVLGLQSVAVPRLVSRETAEHHRTLLEHLVSEVLDVQAPDLVGHAAHDVVQVRFVVESSTRVVEERARVAPQTDRVRGEAPLEHDALNVGRGRRHLEQDVLGVDVRHDHEARLIRHAVIRVGGGGGEAVEQRSVDVVDDRRAGAVDAHVNARRRSVVALIAVLVHRGGEERVVTLGQSLSVPVQREDAVLEHVIIEVRTEVGLGAALLHVHVHANELVEVRTDRSFDQDGVTRLNRNRLHRVDNLVVDFGDVRARRRVVVQKEEDVRRIVSVGVRVVVAGTVRGEHAAANVLIHLPDQLVADVAAGEGVVVRGPGQPVLGAVVRIVELR